MYLSPADTKQTQYQVQPVHNSTNSAHITKCAEVVKQLKPTSNVAIRMAFAVQSAALTAARLD